MLDELRLILQLAVGIVFLLSASGKLSHPTTFARGVKEYKLLPDSLAFGVGLLLIPLEILLGISHVLGWLLAYTAPLAVATLVSFAIAVGVNLKRGRVLSCYCFGGKGGEQISKRTLGRLGLLIAAELIVLADPALFAADRLTYPERVGDIVLLSTLMICAVFVLVAARWVLTVPDVIDLFRPCPTCAAQLRLGAPVGRKKPRTEKHKRRKDASSVQP